MAPGAAVSALQGASCLLQLPVDIDLYFRALLGLNLDPVTIVERTSAFLEAPQNR
jgi:hypothetical protein